VCRHLGIKQPHLKGQDVKEVQRKLGLRGKDVDGFYGPATAGRVQEWKWRNGFPENRITTSLGLPGLALLFGEMELPADFRRRAKQRKGKPFLPTKDGNTLPLPPPVPHFSEFAFVEPQGAPNNQGVRHMPGSTGSLRRARSSARRWAAGSSRPIRPPTRAGRCSAGRRR
jgi:peptidoglycan hydrolase-like protein with peptidoglycan-binding domain